MRPSDRRPNLKMAGTTGYQSVQPTFGRYAACYGLYAVVLAACYANFWAWERVVKIAILAWLSGNIATEAFYAFSMVFVGGVLFAVALVTEHLLRTSVPRGRLVATFKRIGIWLLAGFMLALLLVTLVDVLFVR